MPIIDEPQVRAACDLNARLNVQTAIVANGKADEAALPALLDELQTTADLALSESRTLPAAAYTSEAFYRWEEKHVFRAEWQCVAHISQLPAIGDFLTLDLL